MVRSCCAYNCTARDVKETREAGVKFYRIPQNEAKRKRWLNAVNRKDFHSTQQVMSATDNHVKQPH